MYIIIYNPQLFSYKSRAPEGAKRKIVKSLPYEDGAVSLEVKGNKTDCMKPSLLRWRRVPKGYWEREIL